MGAATITVGVALIITGPSDADAASTSARSSVAVSAAQNPGTVEPTQQEAAAIEAAVRTSPFLSAVPSEDYEVTGILLANSDPSWALIRISPVTDDLDPAAGIVRLTGDDWKLVQIGTYEVGCGLVPDSVAADLALECPSYDAPDRVPGEKSAEHGPPTYTV